MGGGAQSPQATSAALNSSTPFPSFPPPTSTSSTSALPSYSHTSSAASSSYLSSSPPFYHSGGSLFSSSSSNQLTALGASSPPYNDLEDFHLDTKFSSLSSRAAALQHSAYSTMSSLYPMHYPASVLPLTHRKECWDWLAGRCTRGSTCKYTHANAGAGGVVHQGMAGGARGGHDNVCHQWTRAGQCQYGDVCKFAHISPLQQQQQQQGVGGAMAYARQQPSQSEYGAGDVDEYSQGSTGSPLLFFKEQSTSASSPPILFRDARLGLDTEVCRFYAKHSRCKYSNACKFVHVHHGGGGMQVSGVNVTIGELHRLCALHGPGGMSMVMQMGGAGAVAAMSGMRAKSGPGGGPGVLGYDKEYATMEREAREMRELKELRDLQAQRDRAHGLGSSASSPTGPSSFRDLPATTSTRSTPTLGGGLNGTLSPSLLHLSGMRQGVEGKAVGGSLGGGSGYPSPLSFPSSSPSSSSSLSSVFPSSFRVTSAESASNSPSVATSTTSAFSSSPPSFSQPRPIIRSSLSFTHHTSADLSDYSTADYLNDDDDALLISGSTFAALNGSGTLASRMMGGGGYAGYEDATPTPSPPPQASRGSADLRQNGGFTGSSPVACQHCGVNKSAYHNAYSHLCEGCYTSLLR